MTDEQTTGKTVLFGKPAAPDSAAATGSAAGGIATKAGQVESGETQQAFGDRGQGDSNRELSTSEEVVALEAKADVQSTVSELKNDSIDAVAALEAEATFGNDSRVATYSSAPIARFRVGRFQFEKGLLALTGDDIEAFESLMSGKAVDSRTKSQVKRVNTVAAAAAVSQSFLESKRVRGVDTSSDRPGAY